MDANRDRDNALEAGQAALARACWAEARAAFESAARRAETAEALEGLGDACSWLEDVPAAFTARRRAYRLYRDGGDRRGAARVASALAWDHFFEGEHAVADGWIRRAYRLLDGLPPTPELGWLAITDADMAYFVDHDPAATERHAIRAAELGRSLADADLEMLALAYQGLATVSQGRIRDGMRLLDEATAAAVAGEMSQLDAAATACCCLIYACERVRDYERAAQWCRRMEEFCERWSYQMMFSLCRTHYAGVLIWRGDWADAETELRTALAALETTRPAQAAEALVKLAELRCRQGRVHEAEAFLTRAESHPFQVLAADLALLIRAALALEREDPATAVDCAERFLRAMAEEGRMERTACLELLVRAKLALGDHAGAERAVQELRAIADDVHTDPLLGAACLTQGLLAAAAGEQVAAKGCFEDAIGWYARSVAPFEIARARLELARCLTALGRTDPAEEQARAAWNGFRSLGATGEAARAAAVLNEVASTSGHSAVDPAGLTSREIEIVRLIAQGLSNQEIAGRLVLSVRTVERHISNAYEKLGTGGRVGRAAAATYAIGQRLT